ncbi:DNA glycosylase [Pseudarthrobacter sp. PS3-L1]|uniref:Fpg/Nei family DNA glycosylase n=1 Tax=Pseudarthrobacter sp. PS3-L1 TaxID=3046207 RepID=UPI0024B89B98|nr:DNA glycosylase [Pseudarthrobacter sp. PS3-L1]MDJ0319835.1 DNA-formamidopyrimidine glycosylase family protein [Pseudarthrobacter sp. PS3-L1]
MPEGHSVHRLAQQFRDIFTDEKLTVTSPQGRFVAGAAVLDGHVMESTEAHGKHMFLHFDNGLQLHVHLGLYGAWSFGGDATFRGASSIGAPRRVGERETFDAGAAAAGMGTAAGTDGEHTAAGASAKAVDGDYAGPPPPVGAVRVRLESRHGWADLRGATACEALTEEEAARIHARLGPDPLRNSRGDAGQFAANLQKRKPSIAALLMDQKIIAGVGNVYRAEVLFRERLNPYLPGGSLSDRDARKVWRDVVRVMNDGVVDGKIITTPAKYWTRRNGKTGRLRAADGTVSLPKKTSTIPVRADAHYVYKREGLPCRVCGTVILMADLVGRKLYWCPSCQQA